MAALQGLFSTCRDKAALFQWSKAHPAIAPGGSSRGKHGGDEMSEAHPLQAISHDPGWTAVDPLCRHSARHTKFGGWEEFRGEIVLRCRVAVDITGGVV